MSETKDGNKLISYWDEETQTWKTKKTDNPIKIKIARG